MLSQLRFWLTGQAIWLGLAVAYNVVGIWNMANDGRALVGDAPERTLIMVLPYAFVILAGLQGWSLLYRYVTPSLLAGLAYVGFWRHIEASGSVETMAVYSSNAAWYLAVVINGYGCVVFLVGLIIAWRPSS